MELGGLMVCFFFNVSIFDMLVTYTTYSTESFACGRYAYFVCLWVLKDSQLRTGRTVHMVLCFFCIV